MSYKQSLFNYYALTGNLKSMKKIYKNRDIDIDYVGDTAFSKRFLKKYENDPAIIEYLSKKDDYSEDSNDSDKNENPLILLDNRCALGLSIENYHLHIVKYLLKNGANIHIDKECALSTACANGDLNILNLLLKNGADINDKRAFYSAVMNGQSMVINLLFVYGAEKRGYECAPRIKSYGDRSSFFIRYIFIDMFDDI